MTEIFCYQQEPRQIPVVARFEILSYIRNISDLPQTARDASFHRGRHAQRLVNTAQVVVHEGPGAN